MAFNLCPARTDLAHPGAYIPHFTVFNRMVVQYANVGRIQRVCRRVGKYFYVVAPQYAGRGMNLLRRQRNGAQVHAAVGGIRYGIEGVNAVQAAQAGVRGHAVPELLLALCAGVHCGVQVCGAYK